MGKRVVSILKTGSTLASAAIGKGDAGFLTITTDKFNLSDGGQATVSSKGSGTAGLMLVKAQDINLNNQAKISAQTESGVGGNITLDGLNYLRVNNSEISAATNSGTAGDLTINASELVEVLGKGGLSVQASNRGIAGNLAINTRRLNVKNEAEITVSSPEGQAGNLTITADNLLLDRGILAAETGMKTDLSGANINLSVKDLLLMQNNSMISAKASNAADGGNITINNSNGFIVVDKYGNNDIIANAFQGDGGIINISTLGIFGLEYRSQLTPFSDLNASSKFGINGQVTINTLNIDPSSGLVELPTSLVEASSKISQNCSGGGNTASRNNRFTITGRDGLPQSPNDQFTGITTLTDIFDVSDRSHDENASTVQNNTNQEIREAQGWVKDAEGKIVFVAEVKEVTPHSQSIHQANCQAERVSH
jgi:large exoprotein involved in heme utilization and adhesion